MEYAIHTMGLRKQFGGNTAVDDLWLKVQPGEIFGLVGPDGAGKSTTMRMLAGILEPTDGRANVAGNCIIKEAERLKDHIAYMSQAFGLYPDLTVSENIEFYADLYGVPRKGRSARIDELLDFSYMRPFKLRLAGNLSGGMKQKLQLICALVHTPEVLLLDEPTNGVDPVSRRDFWRILYQLAKDGVTVFVSTSYLDEAERCSRLALLHDGKLLALGTPSEVKQLIKGVILEIRTSESRRAEQHLKKQLGGSGVSVFGDRVHVLVEGLKPGEDEARLRSLLVGFPIESIRPVTPSLEDVFVSVVAGQGEGQRG